MKIVTLTLAGLGCVKSMNSVVKTEDHAVGLPLDILNTKDIEFNSVAISVLWHELSRLPFGQINVAGHADGRKRENSCLKRSP